MGKWEKVKTNVGKGVDWLPRVACHDLKPHRWSIHGRATEVRHSIFSNGSRGTKAQRGRRQPFAGPGGVHGQRDPQRRVNP